MFGKILFSIALPFIATFSWANGFSCADYFASLSTSEQEVLSTQLDRLQNGESLSNRQVLGNEPAYTPLTEEFFAEYGIKRWGYRIYLFPFGTSLKKVQNFHNRIFDPVLRGSYLILPEGIQRNEIYRAYNALPGANRALSDSHQALLKRAFQEGKLIDIKDPKEGTLLRSIDGATVLKGFPVQRWMSTRATTERWRRKRDGSRVIIQYPRLSFIVADAWTAPLYEGQLHRTALAESAESLRKLRSRWNRIADQFEISFNSDFDGFITALANTYRKSTGGRNKNVQSSEAAQRSERELYQVGKAHSFEIRSRATGELVAGLLVHQDGNWITLKTPYYPDSEKTSFMAYNPEAKAIQPLDIPSIDLGKMAVLLFSQWADEQSISELNVEMVTPFTRSIRGKNYDREEAQAIKLPYRKATTPIVLQGTLGTIQLKK